MKINPNPMGQKKYMPPPGVFEDEPYVRETGPVDHPDDSIELSAEIEDLKIADVS